ncbi:MAG: hypothetical protein R3C25_02700 [Hyphomonadaceae bacterium]
MANPLRTLWRGCAAIGAALCVLAAGGDGAAQPQMQCSGGVNLFGRYEACMPAPPPFTASDYGYAWIRFQPASAGQIFRNRDLNRSWLDNVRRMVYRTQRSAVVTLEIMLTNDGGQNYTRIAALPLMALSTAEGRREGLRIVDQQSILARPTPYFLIGPQTTLVPKIEVRFSSAAESNIVEYVTRATETAAAFGGHGFLVTALSGDAVSRNASSFEQDLNLASQERVSAQLEVDLGFRQETPSRLSYSFRLDPRADQGGELGVLTLELRRAPAWPEFAQGVRDTPLGAVPDYRTGSDYGSAAYNRFLNYEEFAPIDANSDRGRRFVEMRSQFRTAGDEASFDRACRDFLPALNNPFGLSQNDAMVVFWAELLHYHSGQQALIRSACVNANRAALGRYGLAMPPGDDAGGGDETPVGDGQMRNFLENQWIKVLESHPDMPGKVDWLERLLADDVDVTQVEPGVIFRGPREHESRGSLADALSRVWFEAECFYRPPEEQEVRLFARRHDDGHLMLMSVGLTNISRRLVAVRSIGLRETSDDDFAAMRRFRPSDTRCHSAETAAQP